MGWTFYPKPANVKADLERNLTWTDSNGSRRVLKSGIVARNEFYAAVEHVAPDGTRKVWAAAHILKFAPSAADGYTFGVKEQSEDMGPYIARCPESILELLTPTESDWANKWRQQCRDYHTRRRERVAMKRKALADYRAACQQRGVDPRH